MELQTDENSGCLPTHNLEVENTSLGTEQVPESVTLGQTRSIAFSETDDNSGSPIVQELGESHSTSIEDSGDNTMLGTETEQIPESDVTVILDQTRSLVRSDTFVSEKESVKPKKTAKPSKNLRKVPASSTVSQLRGKSQPGNIEVKASHTSTVSSTSLKQNSMSLPHTLGSIPKYLQQRSIAQINIKSNQQTNLRGTSRSGKVTAETSFASIVSSTSSKQSAMTLPHALGSLPKYLQRSTTHVNTESRPQTENALMTNKMSKSLLPRQSNLSNATSQILETEASDDITSRLKSQIKEMNVKALESKNKIFALSQKVDSLKKQLLDNEHQLIEANSALKEKTEKLTKAEASLARIKRDIKKETSEKGQKAKEEEEKFINLQKVNEETLKKLYEKEEICKQLKTKLETVENEKFSLEHTVKTLQQNQADDRNNKQRLNTLEQMISDVETQLKSRDLEIAFMKDDTNLKSLKTQSLDAFKSSQDVDGSGDTKIIRRQVFDLRNSLKKSQLEVQSISSKLSDERHKNHRIESLLQLREEFIKNLQDSDETLRSQLTLQAKDVEKLREKVEQEKQFKTTTNEELQKLHSTLSSQDFEAKNLQLAIDSMDRKLKKWHNKLVEAGISCQL